MQVQSLGGEDPLETAWQPTPVLLPGESMDRGAWWATVQRVAQSRTQLKQVSTHTLPEQLMSSLSAMTWPV